VKTITLAISLILASSVIADEERANIPDAASGLEQDSSEATAPMEVLASPEQTRAFVAAHPRDYWVFGEDRSQSIRRREALPAHWVEAGDGMLERFKGRAQPGEFYVFQLGLYSAREDVGPVRVRFEDLSGEKRRIAAQRMRCLNLGGTDYLGRSFTKDLVVAKGRVQALWIGVDVPADAKGTHSGSIIVAPESHQPTTVRLTLDVEGEPVEDHGDRQPWRLSRLRWLDSTIGLDDNHVVAPFEPVRREGRTLSILGRQVELGGHGLPIRIRSFFSAGNTAIGAVPTEILAKPLEFVVVADAGPVSFTPGKLVFTEEKKGRVQWRSKSHATGLELTVEGMMEFDGALSLRCMLHATEQTAVRDIRLGAALTPEASAYFMGLGHLGGKRPEPVDWKWSRLCQDAFWMGAINAGLKLQFKGNFYLEGLDHTIRNADIDGLYVDDTALGRKSFQRARRIFEHHKKRFLFDLHSWNGVMQRDEWGRINPLLRYCDILPYFDRIWLGEAYSYNNTPPDYWLIEISGIPFGVMGEMLQGGGNPWLGMVYGMTQRLGWSGDPRNIWKVWDEFGMQGSRMFGYWDPDCPVKTSSREVPATAYVKPGKTLIALGNWGAKETRVRLELNWQAMGLDPTKATLFAPDVGGFQPSAVFRPGDLIPVSPKRGRLIIVDETPHETLRAHVRATVEAEQCYLGTWEYTHQRQTYQRRFNPDHSAELYMNGKRQGVWNGFTWRLEGDRLIVHKPDGSYEQHHLDDQGRLVLPAGLGTAEKVP